MLSQIQHYGSNTKKIKKKIFLVSKLTPTKIKMHLDLTTVFPLLGIKFRHHYIILNSKEFNSF